VKEEAAGSCASVDGVSQTPELNTLLLKLAYQIDQVLDTSPKPVQLPNDKRVSFAKALLSFRETRTFRSTAAGFVFEDLFAAGLLKCSDLKLKVLVLCRNTGVADQHALICGLAPAWSLL